MELIRCDACKKEISGNDPRIIVERAGLVITTYGDPDVRWDFCSWKCVKAFAAVK